MNSRLENLVLAIPAWLIRALLSYLQRFGKRGLIMAIILASVPIGLNLATLVILLFHLMLPNLLIKTGFVGLFILMLLSYFLVNTFLENEFLKKRTEIRPLAWLIWMVIPAAYNVGSVLLFIYSFRFL